MKKLHLNLSVVLLLVASCGLLGACTSSEPSHTGEPVGDPSTTTEPSEPQNNGTTPGDDTETEPEVEQAEPIEVNVEPGCNPIASTRECLFPIPSRFFEREDISSPTGVRWDYKQEGLALPTGEMPVNFDRYNRADGASPAMPILLHFGVDVAPEFLIDQSNIGDSLSDEQKVHLIDLTTGDSLPFMLEMDANLRDLSDVEDRFALIVRPMKPMSMGHRHAVVIEKGLLDVDGQPLPESPGFIALRDNRPSNNEALEAHRASYEELFTTLENYGHERSGLFLAWDFAVASEEHLLGPVQSMRDQALAYVDANGFSYQIESIERDINENMSMIVKGTFDVPCFLTETNELVYAEDGTPVMQGMCNYPFTMGAPAVANEKGNLRFTLIGHGIFGEGWGYISDHPNAYERTHPMAQATESVVIATNWIGLSGGDRNLIISEVVGDLNRLSVVTDRLQQSLINNVILMELTIRALQFDPALEVAHAPLIGDEKVGYYGISLGGIQGTSLTSLSDRIDRAILAVPGGAWSTMLPRSVVYQPIKMFVDQLYPDPLTQLAFVSFLQGMFDFTDPINLSHMMKQEDGSLKAKVILQEAIGDCQVPNLNTRMLARNLDLVQLTPAVEDVWGLEQSDTGRGGALVQFTLPENLAEYYPPDEAVVPAQDNGTHSDATFSEPGFNQIITLIRDGVISQTCDGACDPD
ncbi:MAG: hypothetical protein HOK28_18075 [Deltaproteobacteria bacterium]|nr:hypothetical protein [Deltaproteobacteria bacterium]